MLLVSGNAPKEDGSLAISWIWEGFHPLGELPIKALIYYSLCKTCLCNQCQRKRKKIKTCMEGLLVLNHRVCRGWAAPSTSSDIWLQLALRALRALPTRAGNLFLGIVTVLSCFSLMFWTAFPPLHMFEWKQRALSLVLLFPEGEVGKRQAALGVVSGRAAGCGCPGVTQKQWEAG